MFIYSYVIHFQLLAEQRNNTNVFAHEPIGEWRVKWQAR